MISRYNLQDVMGWGGISKFHIPTAGSTSQDLSPIVGNKDGSSTFVNHGNLGFLKGLLVSGQQQNKLLILKHVRKT